MTRAYAIGRTLSNASPEYHRHRLLLRVRGWPLDDPSDPRPSSRAGMALITASWPRGHARCARRTLGKEEAPDSLPPPSDPWDRNAARRTSDMWPAPAARAQMRRSKKTRGETHGVRFPALTARLRPPAPRGDGARAGAGLRRLQLRPRRHRRRPPRLLEQGHIPGAELPRTSTRGSLRVRRPAATAATPCPRAQPGPRRSAAWASGRPRRWWSTTRRAACTPPAPGG